MVNKLQELETQRRAHNLIIEGIAETANENIRLKVDKLFEVLGLEFGQDWCDTIYRMGQKKQTTTRPRPIFISFPYLRLKTMVLGNAYKLKDLEGRKYPYLTDDMTPEEQSKRRDLRSTLQTIERKAREELTNLQYDMVFIMLGVNNITCLFHKKKQI